MFDVVLFLAKDRAWDECLRGEQGDASIFCSLPRTIPPPFRAGSTRFGTIPRGYRKTSGSPVRLCTILGHRVYTWALALGGVWKRAPSPPLPTRPQKVVPGQSVAEPVAVPARGDSGGGMGCRWSRHSPRVPWSRPSWHARSDPSSPTHPSPTRPAPIRPDPEGATERKSGPNPTLPGQARANPVPASAKPNPHDVSPCWPGLCRCPPVEESTKMFELINLVSRLRALVISRIHFCPGCERWSFPAYFLPGLPALVIPRIFSARAASAGHSPHLFLPGLRALVITEDFLVKNPS
eukprot:gene24833-biopygen23928